MRTFKGIACGSALLALAACGGSGPSAAGAEAGGSGSGGSSPVQFSDCKEAPIFPARAYGENGADLIRSIVREDTTGDLFFSDFAELYRIPGGTGEPVLVGTRPNEDINGAFWLAKDSFLFPGGFSVPLIETPAAVLSSTDRGVMDPKVVVPLPTPASIKYQYDADSVIVLGDDVYWIASDKYTDDPTQLPPKWQTTYTLRKTSWQKPAKPEEVYSSDHALKGLLIAGTRAFVDQEMTPGENDYVQKIVDLTSGQLDSHAAQELFGGEVVAGDDASLLVSRTNFEVPDQSGLFRVAPDGSKSTKLSSNSFIQDFGYANGTWVFDDSGLGDSHSVWSYRVDTGLKQVGCIAKPVTVHALAVSDTTAWVSIYRDSQATVLRFSL